MLLFWVCSCKNIQQIGYKKISTLKKFLKTLSLFSQGKIQKKRGLDRSHDVTGSVNIYSVQVRRQDSVDWGGGAKINFGGHEKFIYVNSMGARGHEKLQKRTSSQNFLKLWLSSPNSCDFSRILNWRQKQKKVFVLKLKWNPVQVHKNSKKAVLAHEFQGCKHLFGCLRPRIALQ